MTILITGYPGYIASHLYLYLKDRHKVVVSGRRSSTTIDCKNYIEMDITNQNKLNKALKVLKPDWVIHCAGINNSTTDYRGKESKAIIFEGTKNLLYSVKNYSSCTKIIHLSSRQEYGKPEVLPVDENHLTNPISLYGKYKLVTSQFILRYAKKNNIDTMILRISNIYGSELSKFITSEDSNKVILNKMIAMASEHKEITLFGRGDQLRDYLYIEDFCRLIDIIIQKNIVIQSIYNVGYGKGISIRKAVNMITNYYVSTFKVEIWPKNWHTIETGSYISNITKVKHDYDWKPLVSFRDGLYRTFLNIENEKK